MANTIVLKQKGEKANFLKKKTQDTEIKVTLRWTAGVDLDLHAFGITKGGSLGSVTKGGSLGSVQGELNHIYFSSKGKKNKAPYIALDTDSGVGNTAGDNEENLVVYNLGHYRRILFAANIFRFNPFSSRVIFGKYDGSVIFKALDEEIQVPLNAKEKGKWALISMIEHTSPHGEANVVNINIIQKNEPTLAQLESL